MANSEVIEVRLQELRQLFNAMDPSPFHERDLDSNAEEFIVGWASEIPPSVPVALVISLERPTGAADDSTVLRDAVRRFFGRKAVAARRRLRELFHRGRISLIIGLGFLAAASVLANALAGITGSGLAVILRESVLIGGWVAMWRPLEVFLYDWWPIRAEARRYDRLAAMPVRIQHAPANAQLAPREDPPP